MSKITGTAACHFWNFNETESGECTLRIEGEIASDTWFGDEVTPQIFMGELANFANRDITVWISSPGGDVIAASRIYTALKEHKGQVTVKIDGLAASAASVIAMSGDFVFMSPSSIMMVHDPMGFAAGNVADLEQCIEVEQGILPMSLKRLYGYRRTDDGGFRIIQEEAEVIRLIFSSYLSGLGMKLICDMLNEKKIPSPKGGLWNEKGLRYLITNEKYCGDILLLKSFRTDHITKKRVKNRGERDQYYVEDNHQPIILKETFYAVQAEMKKRARENAGVQPKSKYPFTGMILCRNCGKNYTRKVSNCSKKYRRVFWNCATFLRHGKDACHSKQIPEDTLLEISAEVLGTQEFDEKIFKQKIQRIEVSEWNKVVFIFKNGSEIEKEWQDKSRKWTEEMKACQREKSRLSQQGNNS